MLLEPRKALNKAFLKIKPNRIGIELFKQNLILLLDSSKEKESEEFHKNLISDFLKNTYYSPNHFINTKGRNDLVIHIGKEAKTNVGVIIEAKSPTNKAEMLSENNINSKAIQELVLYFLRERITHKNLEVKHIVVSNLNEWFIFDAQLFDKLFAQNKSFVKQFQEFEEGKLSGTNTDFFYKEIAKPFIETILDKLEYTYFDLATYDKILRNTDKQDDNKLIVLYKLLSPEHLLKLSFANDSNSLDKNFYNELLHLIGLVETKEGGKKLIERPKAGQRNAGSLLENTINQLDSLDKLSRLPNVKQYGDTHEERLFTVGLELCITWVNRILFLKLLEAQLISYHKGDKSYAFLHNGLLHDYDNLNALFFMVLAKKPEERNDRVKTLFAKVPYLNSSLFEPTELEHQTLFIAGLEDDIPLQFISGTVIKDTNGKKYTAEHNAINYFFDFLDAYDFASEGSEDIQEDNKTLINASVLGLIFEKINGYKDGSFFTPSFITMYMCKETIRRTVVQKFNEVKGWDCADFDALYNKIDDTKEANKIINSVKICDPAVGSGHFLVSALNEMISIKHDLKVLTDRDNKRLKEYQVDIVNDELIVTDEDGLPFVYNPKNKESQRIQETLFHEKQTIIEKCLFGVDINPNSVKICRLRLWIELLKNAYYKSDVTSSGIEMLETLPNIDINIKCGNSLISRFGLDADLKNALKKSKLKIEDYKNAVDQYHNAESKEQKRDMEQLIAEIKTNFRTEINQNGKEIKELLKLKYEFNVKFETEQLFETKLTKAELKAKKDLSDKIDKIETQLEEIKSNKIYENAFEWRFEFPEVLNDEGDFVGFDTIIGNPPYVQLQKMGQDSIGLEKMDFETYAKAGDIYSLFYELGFNILCQNGLLTFITSNKWMRAAYGESLRKYFVEKTNPIMLIDFGGIQVFDTATVDTNIFMGSKSNYTKETLACVLNKEFNSADLNSFVAENSTPTLFKNESWVILSAIEKRIKEKIEKIGTPLKDWDIQINYGIKTGYNEAFIIDGKKRDELIKEDPKSVEIIRPILRGRDIKKYSYEFADLYIITTFPSLKIDIEMYSAVKQHLLSFGFDRLKQTGDVGSRKKSNNKWFETQDSIGYWEDFSKQKIIWIELADKGRFAIDISDKYLTLNGTFIMTGNDLEFICAVLNNPITSWHFNTFCISSGVGTNQWRELYVRNLLIPNIPIESQINIVRLIKDINDLEIKKKDYKNEIDRVNMLIYNLFELNNEEISFIQLQ